MASDRFIPRHAAPRSPGERRETDGEFVQPPTYPQMGGFTGPGKVRARTGTMKLGTPGQTEK